ncbi:uncharacterized protein [Maniola hyperantus]|uniref:uncharacterized protein n=1 Tax=Aphantopus hyperantus TaxID=2795564 RepID=UPI0037479FE6
MEVPVTRASAGKARKRTRNPENWKANIAKKKRYMPKKAPERIICSHKNKHLKCSSLTMTDIMNFHSSFYSSNKRSEQDALILKCCKTQKVKRRRPTKSIRLGRDFNIKYSVFRPRNDCVPVCQKAFLNILGITKYRVEYALKHLFHTGEIARERRGGNRKINKFKEQKESIIRYIIKLKCIESHYCRSSSQERKYLSSDLSINKLYKMFRDENPVSPVKQSYFRHIFNREFNLGFGTPNTDACSTCIELNERIKKENDRIKKNELMTALRVHKLRAKAFFKMLQEQKDDMITFSFDCQKNSPLPRIPDQSAYYSRQFYLYNFTIVQGSSKDKLNKNTTFAYTWTENEFGKTANQIASAVYDRLNKTNLSGITIIRLFADGCGGQNKNSIMLSMLSQWLLKNVSVKRIEIIFPVTGHSFMPPDRVFGNIEKVLKKREVIIQPEEYCDIISSNATVTNLKDIIILDFKRATQEVFKPTAKWPFKITECKRFIIKRSKISGNTLIRGEPFYYSDINKAFNVCKTGKNTSMLQPTTISTGVPVAQAKITDVEKLLAKHFGLEWQKREDLQFYLDIIRGPFVEGNQDLEESFCEGIAEESPVLRI